MVLLVTQEDKPVGRKQLLTPPDTKAWALREAITLEVYQQNHCVPMKTYEKIASLKPC